MQTSPTTLSVAINALLEVLYIMHHDGHFSDKDVIIETLLKIGVSDEKIKYITQ